MEQSELADEFWGDESFNGDFRLATESRLRDKYTSTIFDNPVYGRPLELSETRSFAQLVEQESGASVAPSQFESNDELFALAERVMSEIEGAEVLFGGEYGGLGYIDTMYVTPGPDLSSFKEYCVLHFKQRMSHHADQNAGICPYCDNRIELSDWETPYRSTESDTNLLATPDEFDFRNYPGYGDCARLWFDE